MAVKKRIEYIDTMKAVAIFSVIWIHVGLIWEGSFAMGLSLYSIAELGRFAVPLFLMVSGALLLNREYELKSFFSRRLTRIIFPYLLWVIPYLFYFIATNNFIIDWNVMVGRFFNRWYFWMIIGIYCTIPIINEFIKNKGMDGVKYFLILAIIASVYYQTCKLFDLTTFLDLRFFVGALVYMMLGYYFNNYEFKSSPNKIITISIIIFLITTAIKVFLADAGITAGFLNFANPKIFLDSHLDANIISYIRVTSIFLIIKYIYEEDTNFIYSGIRKILEFGIIKKVIKSISRASYGIYLTQDLAILILGVTLTPLIPLCGKVLVIYSVGILIVCWAVILIVNKIPHLAKWSGYD